MKDFLIDPLKESNEYASLLQCLSRQASRAGITGPAETQKIHLAYGLCSHLGRKAVYIAADSLQARYAFEDAQTFFRAGALFFPARELIPYNIEARSYDSVHQRIIALDRMMRGDYSLIVTTLEAISLKLPPHATLASAVLDFGTGDSVRIDDIYARLFNAGYERVDLIEGRGQFAARGGIVDVFPVNEERPFRIELFDDVIESIRWFDTGSQRSYDNAPMVRVLPARDIIHSKDTRSEGDEPPGIDRYIPFVQHHSEFLPDYFNPGEAAPLIIIDEPKRAVQHLNAVMEEYYESCAELMQRGLSLTGGADCYHDPAEIVSKFRDLSVVGISVLKGGNVPLAELSGVKPREFVISSKGAPVWHGRMEIFKDDLKRWKEKGIRVVVFAGSVPKAQNLSAILSGDGIEAPFTDRTGFELDHGQVVIVEGNLRRGFEYPEIGIVFISSAEIAARPKKPVKTGSKRKGLDISSFTDLNQFDYVVHQSHGIGQYVGMRQLVVENAKRDYLKIKYKDGDFLYIPSTQLDSIQKYIGSEGKAPRLNRLGGSEWAKTKKRVRESLKELAFGLLQLYAQRQALRGHVYPADTVWQRQFEEQFPYEETEDQLKCVEEIKKDMESDRPMDRLLCGDVGYGKTEVAIRAVFKAVMDGKQVAYLVPTTVLAQQHYLTFTERMKDFPVTVDVISRFRSRSEQAKILKSLKEGNIDVLIGTHRLLQKDIGFKDIGLLIVDEEQRFGVIHKENIKNISPDIDVLTLTATPIPRTLHMSLAGIRDISTLEDPPENRYPVQTYVMEYDQAVIREAIIRELSRGGQVFYLSNRVRSIDIKAFQLHQIVPEARIAVAHGQMEEKQLEDVMYAFINREYDLLVCTTIIESGLDMPNVNTLIVEDADLLGLAQLYQLRGRVGRSDRQAYAYITHKTDKSITEIAEKRLKAIRDFTEFGSGFKIAMRDLEIRGAGNLLGPEQHGHIESVGYEMYCRLLDEAVGELRGGTTAAMDEMPETLIDLNINAYISDEYIGAESQRIGMYKKIALVRDEAGANEVRDELDDMYGDIPPEVQNLINIALVKASATSLGITSICAKSGSIIMKVNPSALQIPQAIAGLAAKYRRRLMFNAGSSPYLSLKMPEGADVSKYLENIKIILQDIKCFEL